MIYIILLVAAIVVGGYLAISALYDGGNSLSENTRRSQHNQLVNGTTQVAMALHQYMLLDSQGELPTEEDLSGRTVAQFLVDETNHLSSIPMGVSSISGGQEWILKDGYIAYQMLDAEQCALENSYHGGSGNIEDIPSCSEPFDQYNPCCM